MRWELPAGPPAWDWAALRTACANEARRLVSDAHDADEVVQEALMRAWRRRGTCRAASNPLPWVRQIARMEAYRLLRRRAVRHHREGVELLEGDAGATPSHSEALLDRVSVAQALADLPPDQRALIIARYVDDLSQPAVAALFEIPEGTAKVRLHRVRQRLRSALEEAA